MKIKKILFLTMGSLDHASSRVRVLQFIPELKESKEFEIHTIARIPKKPKTILQKYLFFPIIKRYYSIQKILFLLIKKWDIIFIQKIFLPLWILNFIKNKSKIIFDFDDAIYLGLNNERKTANMLKTASEVIVSTKHLEPFCLKYKKKPTIIGSSVDTQKLIPLNNERESEKIIIGWIGSPWTSKFLKEIESPLKELSKKYNIKLLIIGAKKDFQIESLDIEIKKWDLNKEVDELNRMDIGIMPLNTDQYSKGKGGFKLIQYMSVGIPIIASSVGINKSIVEHNVNGFLAESNEDWIKYLSILIENERLRNEFGSKGRRLAVEKYSKKASLKKMLPLLRK